MVLDSRIAKVRDFFGLWKTEDFCSIEPEQILRVPDVGRVTLDHLRVLLAARNLTLKNDRTPEYWQQNLSAVRIETQLGDRDAGEDQAVVTPFTVLIDSAEQQPFNFCGIQTDAAEDNRPLIVKTAWRSLGRHPNGLGDYSIDGFAGRCHVERKSLEDCQGTILGFNGQRERFEQELKNLSGIETGLIVVEASLQAVLQQQSTTGNRKKSPALRAKTIFRSVLAWQQDHAVPWLFCDSRRLAELATFRFLERFWRKHQQAEKTIEKLVQAI